MMAIFKRPIVVEVKVPAHSVILTIRFKMIFGKLGVVRGAVLLVIALAAAATVTCVVV